VRIMMLNQKTSSTHGYRFAFLLEGFIFPQG
jgi:hypothetical protein